MPSFLIRGGIPLRGEVAVGGAKNAALPIVAASILADGPVAIANVPRLRDVQILRDLLHTLGIHSTHSGSGRVILECVDENPTHADYRFVRRMRASFCVLGPLLARRGQARVALPGGCNIGHRPVDVHLAGLAALGADITARRGYVTARATRLRGADITLSGPHGPTVTGTANVMCAATRARRITIIRGAAQEPEIVDLARFLNQLGARITGAGSPTIEIRGVDYLGQPDTYFRGGYSVIPDRIEAATFLIAAMITRGSLEVRNVDPSHMGSLLDVLRIAGAQLDVRQQAVRIDSPSVVRPFQIVAQPYPGIPSDVQAQLVSLACVAEGRSTVRDHVFPERWSHVAELARMSAQIQRAGDGIVVDGVATERDRHLAGTAVRGHDLRGGAALVLAGLAARGLTSVQCGAHLDRGYERLERKLAGLGAEVRRSRHFARPHFEQPATKS